MSFFSSFTVVTRLRAERLWLDSRQDINFHHNVGYLCSGVNWQGREANRLLPSSSKVKNAWSSFPVPPYVCMALCLVLHHGWLYFCLLPVNLKVCSELLGQNAIETVPCNIRFKGGTFVCWRPTINWTVGGALRGRIAHVLCKGIK
jgi:hypothetical protein